MRIFKTNGDSKFEIAAIEQDDAPSELVKVRITHVLPCASDVEIFSGDSATEYPFVIGRAAIGVISDDREEYGLKRGAKVILNPYRIVKRDKNDQVTDVSTMGTDVDGFMRELIRIDKQYIIPFPEEVDEDEAIFAERISIALRAFNSCEAEKGSYVAVIGSDTVCNIIAQLAIYFQMVPVMIGSNVHNLQIASSCGIYFTVDESKESALERVKEITCGKMADLTFISVSHDTMPNFLFNVTKEGGKCVIIGDEKSSAGYDADLSEIVKRKLTVYGVSDGASEFDSAINILAQKVIQTDGFIEKTVEVKDAEILLREMRENPERYFNAVIKM